MLTPDTLNAFVQRDTAVVASALIGGSLIGTEAGDAVLAAIGNYPDRAEALHAFLARAGVAA